MYLKNQNAMKKNSKLLNKVKNEEKLIATLRKITYIFTPHTRCKVYHV